MQSFWSDLRTATRLLWREKRYSILVILVLGLGIGTNTVAFAFVYGLLLQPLPFRDQASLVGLGLRASTGDQLGISLADLEDWRKSSSVFSHVAGHDPIATIVTARNTSHRVEGAEVTASLFATLGVAPVTGRTFLPAEDRPGVAGTALLGENFARRIFGETSSALGHLVQIGGTTYTVIGVMPETFTFPQRAEFWIPAGHSSENLNRENFDLMGVARLAAGRTFADAESEAAAFGARLSREYPVTRKAMRGEAYSLRQLYVSRALERGTVVVQALVAFLLLLACCNLLTLLAGRILDQKWEIAIRAALGASRQQMVRPFVLENSMLALVGGGAGLLFARIALALVIPTLPMDRLGPFQIGLNSFVALTPLVLALLVAGAFAMLPLVWRHILADPVSFLRGGATATGSPRERRWRRVLVSAQVALCFVLVIGAGLAIRSFAKLTAVKPGFEGKNLLTLVYALPSPNYPSEQRIRFAGELLDSIHTIPGIASASGITRLPVAGATTETAFRVEGALPTNELPIANLNVILPSYFETMQIPLHDGRDFSAVEAQGRERNMVIISQDFARLFWPGESAVGKRIQMARPGFRSFAGATPEWHVVAGVVGNVHEGALESTPLPAIYMPFARFPATYMTVVVRSTASPASLWPALRAAVHAKDSQVPVYRTSMMEDLLAGSIWRQRVLAQLTGGVGSFGLLLATAGVFGVTYLAAVRRRREVAVRLALGAEPRDILNLFLRECLVSSLTGIIVGTFVAGLLTRMMAGLLYQTAPHDPVAFLAAVMALLAASLSAFWFPARAAARLSPLEILR